MKLKVGYSLMSPVRRILSYYYNNGELIKRIESKAVELGVIIPDDPEPKYWIFQSKSQYIELDKLFKDEVLNDQWNDALNKVNEVELDIPESYVKGLEDLKLQVIIENNVEEYEER